MKSWTWQRRITHPDSARKACFRRRTHEQHPQWGVQLRVVVARQFLLSGGFLNRFLYCFVLEDLLHGFINCLLDTLFSEALSHRLFDVPLDCFRSCFSLCSFLCHYGVPQYRASLCSLLRHCRATYREIWPGSVTVARISSISTSQTPQSTRRA